jgi:hypothetical protein
MNMQEIYKRNRLLDPLPLQHGLHKFMRPPDVPFIDMFDDQGHVGMILRQKFRIEVVVQYAKARRGKFHRAGVPESVGLAGVNGGVFFLSRAKRVMSYITPQASCYADPEALSPYRHTQSLS